MAVVENQPIQDAPTTQSMAAEPSTMATEATPALTSNTEAVATEIAPEPANNLPGSIPGETEPMQPTEEAIGKDAVKIEAQPASEGVLGYKAPGLIKSLRFSKKYFWFNDEPVDSKFLSTYLRDEKTEIGHHNAAYATQTGKGLLFYAKRVEDKSQPAGILHLADASDVTKEGLTDFSLKLHGHKNTFQAASAAERDSWIVAVESKAAEAKTNLEEVKNSEGYKKSKESFAGPFTAVGGTAATTKSAITPSKSMGPTDNAAETPAEAAVEDTTVPPTAEKKAEKARSQSRKRQSIFGKFVNKKDEADEKREVKKEEKAEKKAEKAEDKEEKKTEKAEEKDEKAAIKEEKKEENAEAREEKEEEKAEKKAEKEVEKEAKLESEIAAPVSMVDGENAKRGTVSSAAPKSSKRSSVFGSFFNKKEMPKEKEKEIAPAVPAKDAETMPITAIAPQIEESAAMKAEQPMMNVTAPGETATEASAVSAPAGETMPTKATAITPDTKEKRRQSFFNLGGKKEKRSEATSDTEGAEKSGSATARGAKLGNVFRRASRSAKPTSSTVTDSGTPPPISKDTEPVAEPAAVEPISSEANPMATENTMSGSTPATVSASA